MIETQEEKGYRGKQCLSFLLYKSRLKKLINVFLVLMKMYKYILWRMKMYKNNKRVFTVSISPLTRALVNRISIINTLAVPSNVGKTYFRGCHIGNKFSLTIFFKQLSNIEPHFNHHGQSTNSGYFQYEPVGKCLYERRLFSLRTYNLY